MCPFFQPSRLWSVSSFRVEHLQETAGKSDWPAFTYQCAGHTCGGSQEEDRRSLGHDDASYRPPSKNEAGFITSAPLPSFSRLSSRCLLCFLDSRGYRIGRWLGAAVEGCSLTVGKQGLRVAPSRQQAVAKIGQRIHRAWIHSHSGPVIIERLGKMSMLLKLERIKSSQDDPDTPCS